LRQHDNSFFGDPVLFRLASNLSAPLLPELAELGAYAASDEAESRARFVARHRPLLHLYDNHGVRCEEIDLHPAYHSLLTRARHAGIASSLFEEKSEEVPMCHQARAMRLMLLSGVECATLQELCLASAALDLLHTDKTLCAEWKPLLISRIHDPLIKPYPHKQSASLGFALSDIDARVPMQALPIREAGKDASGEEAPGVVRLYGRKSAVINPLADGFLVLARFDGRQGLFLVPRLLADGRLNGLRLFPASEARFYPSMSAFPVHSCADIHFHDSAGWFLGNPDAVNDLLSRAQTAIQCDINVMRVGQMRRALRLAVDRVRYESIQGQRSEITALKMRILADAALDCAGATLLVLRTARAFDLAQTSEREAVLAELTPTLVGVWLARIMAPILDCANFATMDPNRVTMTQAQGNFLERAGQILSINGGFDRTPLSLLIDCVDMLGKYKAVIETIMSDLSKGHQGGELLRQAVQMMDEDPSIACLFAEQFVHILACILMRSLDMEIVTSAFIDSRLEGRRGSSYGLLDLRFNPIFILETLYPSA